MESMKSSLLEIGTVILPAVVKAVTKLSEFIKRMSDRFKNLSPFVQKLVLGFGGILTAAGPLLIIFGKIMTGLSALGPVLSLAATGFRALNAVMIANPILAVAAAIAAIGVAIYNYTKSQKDALNQVQTIEQVEQKIAEKRKKLAEEQARVADGYGGQVKKNVENLKQEIAALEEKEKAIRAAAKAVQESGNIPQQDASGSGNEVEKEIEKQKSISDIVAGALEQRKLAVAANEMEIAEIKDLSKVTDLEKTIEHNAFRNEMEQQDTEVRKQRLNEFIAEQEQASARMRSIGSAVDSSFGAIGNSITNMFGGAQSATGAFVGTLAKDALKIVGSNLKIAMGGGIASATESAKSFGPAAAFVLPALIAGATALISGSFSKFADGGIVSGPTMGLVGEYPGARSNPEVISPLNKLQNIIGNTGGSQNINVGGQIRLDGQDLLIAIERANESADRIF